MVETNAIFGLVLTKSILFYLHLVESNDINDIVIDIDSYKRTTNNELVVKGLTAWEKMREKRINGEITDEEYIEWKLNLEL